tara:strand:+ start:65 stop:307 length:243 start_codon:yes stop_codon:yes gene_type:complete
MNMEFCAEKTFSDSWNCLKEANGELLPIVLFAECLWWLFMLVLMRGFVQGIRRWKEKREMKRRMKVEWENKWSFPPQGKN